MTIEREAIEAKSKPEKESLDESSSQGLVGSVEVSLFVPSIRYLIFDLPNFHHLVLSGPYSPRYHTMPSNFFRDFRLVPLLSHQG